jgi:hypothetical protein
MSVLLCGPLYAANTIIWGTEVIDISAMDSDWTWNEKGGPYTSDKEGIVVKYILFLPGAIGDVLVIKNGSATKESLFPDMAVPVKQANIMYYQGRMLKPFIDYSESTLSAGHRVMIGLGH